MGPSSRCVQESAVERTAERQREQMRTVLGVRHVTVSLLTFAGIVLGLAPVTADDLEFRRLPVPEYRDKMKAGWIGQIAGVSWGGPTEFKYQDRIIPEDAMPAWSPEMIIKHC